VLIEFRVRLQAACLRQESPMIVFGSPSRYYQGPGCLDGIGEIVRAIGVRAVVVADAFVLPILDEQLRRSFSQARLEAQVLPFAGDVTHAAVTALVSEVDAGPFGKHADVVVAIGGGKAIDVGKALCHRLGCAVVTVPTAAANDAPTSKNYVVYDENHALVEVAHLPENPRAVLVDTNVIASAPRALLVAGIGDGITKAFEAAQCYAVQGRTMFGQEPSLSALALAEAGYRTIREHAVEGLAVAGTSQSTQAFERLVEALFVMGGLGFESGGLSIAHAMTRGLSRVAGSAKAMHGQQVAYGLLVQLTLEERDDVFMTDLRSFYRTVGLATSLAALGVGVIDDAVYRAIAGPTLAAPHAKNFTRELSEADLVDAMRRVDGGNTQSTIQAGDL
jgi:glycerol dehydrogenase